MQGTNVKVLVFCPGNKWQRLAPTRGAGGGCGSQAAARSPALHPAGARGLRRGTPRQRCAAVRGTALPDYRGEE